MYFPSVFHIISSCTALGIDAVFAVLFALVYFIKIIMRTLVFLSFVIIFSISTCWGRDMIVGTSYNTRLAWQQKAEYRAIPFKKRVKDMFYTDPSQQIIRGVIARDLDHKDGTATITAGGVGFSFVNIRMKSERGGSLNYQIEIYV